MDNDLEQSEYSPAGEGAGDDDDHDADRPDVGAAAIGRGKQIRRSIWMIAAPMIIIAGAVMLVFTSWIAVLEVQRSSMAPALADGDIALFLRTDSVGRGDIIAFHHSGLIQLKRVIAVGGDSISISEDGMVTLNGTPLREPYTDGRVAERATLEHLEVPDGYVFVMGDQRGNSIDSRNEEIGMISLERVIGKSLLRIWPPFWS